MKKCLLALLCVLLLLALTACEQEAATSSQSSSTAGTSSVASTQPTPTPTAEPTPTPAPTPTPSATPTPTPETSSAAEHHQLPPIDTDDPDFAAAFEANSIDAAFLEDSEIAATTLAMNQLFDKYIDKWEEQVDLLYKELLAKTKDGAYGEDAYDTIKTGQEEWVNATPAALDAIRDSVGSGGTAASLDIAAKFMHYYRDRAAELSSIYYQMTGETGIE